MKRLAAVLLLALPASAGELSTFECKRPGCVMVAESALDALIAANDINYDRAQKAEARVKELESGGPKCATLDVTEPPKKLPPLKKERDS